jgi:hypothetical protein
MEYHDIKNLISIDKLLRKIITDNRSYFSVSKTTRSDLGFIEAKFHGRTLLNFIKTTIKELKLNYSKHRLSPYVELLIWQCNDELMEYFMFFPNCLTIEQAINLSVRLNNLVNNVRREAATADFHRKCNRAVRSANKNHHELLKLINSCFANVASRLVFVRVDLAYRKDLGPSALSGQAVSYADVRKDRERLFSKLRSNPIFHGLVAKAWALEYKPRKGFHYHMLFVFDGSKIREDITVGMRILELWRTRITEGRGVGENCNAVKFKYKNRLGIGVINHFDINARKNLEEYVLPYLTKVDYYVKYATPEGDRVFGKSNMPKPKTRKNGRKRRPTFPTNAAQAVREILNTPSN